MNAGAALARPVGPLPLGAWLLVGAGGLWIARTRGDGTDGKDAVANTVTQVPVPVGAIASPDDAAVILNPIIYVTGAASGGTATVPNLPTPTPAPSTTPRPVVALPRPVTKPAPPTSVAKPAASTLRSYTVRAGDTLSKIGNHYGIAWSRIYTRNQSVIEAAARAHGRASSGAGHWIYPGTVLVIP